MSEVNALVIAHGSLSSLHKQKNRYNPPQYIKQQKQGCFQMLKPVVNNSSTDHYDIKHHGATRDVTGSCLELNCTLNSKPTGVLIDYGLFQGEEAQESTQQASPDSILDDTIPFEISHIKALIVTHVHIDHVDRS